MRRIVTALVVGGAIGALAANQWTSPTAIAQSADYRNLDLFGDIYERVLSSYVEQVEEKELVESGINGMLTSLDPHSAYLAPESFRDMQEQTEGKFGGLGIQVTMEDGFVKVVSPIDDTPAARAGIEPNDLITHLDGEAVLGLNLSEAVEKMRGEIGTSITLTIVREGADEPFDVVIERAEIVVDPVAGRAEGDVAYVRIRSFNKQTSESLEKKIEKLTAEIGAEKVKGLVLDLRNNPGGLLSQAVRVSDAFLERGEVVSTRGRDPRDAERYNASEGDLIKGLPLVVLINGGSASASEIVAGAMQDHRRGIVVGVKSFGKGSVQTIMPLSNGGAVKLTTSRYYTPSGRSIQALGIEPDIVVEQLTVERPETEGQRPNEASLRGSLTNDVSDTNGDDVKAREAEAAHQAELREEDYQLSYALDLLRGLTALQSLQSN